MDDGEGHAGIGETAPLPGLHAESVEEAAAQLHELAGQLEGAAIPEGCPALDGAFETWLGGLNLHPSVRTGVEGAVLTLLADRAGKDLPHLLANSPAARVRINGLLDGEPAAVLEGAARLARNGYTALKIKVGRRDAGDEAGLVAAVRGARRAGGRAAPRRQPRLGPGGSHGFRGARRARGVEYLEEPLRDAGDLAAFVADSRDSRRPR